MSDWNKRIIEEFRANNGRVGGMFEGAPLVLLTTAGRRTGRPHTTPAVCLRDGDRYLVFGSNAGGDRHPDWYLNLLASPQVTLELPGEAGEGRPLAARAVPLEGEERDRYWELQCERDPAFLAYQSGTERTIPVVALHPLVLSADDDRARLVGEQLRRHHADLRGQLAALRAEIDQALAGAPATGGTGGAAGAAEELRRHCLRFCYGLQLHHTRENGAFTAFERRFPELAPALDRLRAEHLVVEEALTRFAALLGGEGTGPATLRAELDRLVTGLEEHFAYEEAQLIPAP
ncbi:nitroreductase/quinone reductase family protein [Streptomyces sp. SBT349]|uniref:nitroreductase/quinone reductase family protein n=1 Tax=Streptomyces sp. SBT349 TaxID=1580539 RepID=UPI00066BC74E|nr:nitroreductase/quinone reductase family protein [Streptomyces sp. SBT349]